MEFKSEIRDLKANLETFEQTEEVNNLRKVIDLTLEFYDRMTETRRKEFYSDIRNQYIAILKLREQ